MGTMILYVDDDSIYTRCIKMALEKQAFEIVVCNNAKEAFGLFTAAKFDLCIIDFYMPDISGTTLIRQIRAINKNIPLLAVSAGMLNNEQQQAAEAGADHYLVKPVAADVLVLHIRTLLERVVLLETLRQNGPRC